MKKFGDTAFQVRFYEFEGLIRLVDFYHLVVIMLYMPAMDLQGVEDMKEKLEQVRVVAVTCLGITSPLLTNKRFDVCIMDEAGQTTLPVCSRKCCFH